MNDKKITNIDITPKFSNIYKVRDVATGFLYYQNWLINRILPMIKYDGLPSSLPQDEIEKRLIKWGFSGIFNHKVYGLVTSDGGITGVDIYNHPTLYNYAQPVLGSGVLTIGRECVVMYDSAMNEDYRFSRVNLIDRYARMLADVDASISISTVNSRQLNVYNVKDDAEKQAVQEFQTSVEKGDNGVLLNKNRSLYNEMQSTPFNHDWHIIESLTKVKQDIIVQFFQEIGVHLTKNKMGEMSATEVSADTDALFINQYYLLQAREKGVKQLNEMFGLNVKVSINENYRKGALNDILGIFNNQPTN